MMKCCMVVFFNQKNNFYLMASNGNNDYGGAVSMSCLEQRPFYFRASFIFNFEFTHDLFNSKILYRKCYIHVLSNEKTTTSYTSGTLLNGQ